MPLTQPLPADNAAWRPWATDVHNTVNALAAGTGLPATLVYRVLYSGGAYGPRPTGVAAGYVEYVGPTQPTTWLDGDTWIQKA